MTAQLALDSIAALIRALGDATGVLSTQAEAQSSVFSTSFQQIFFLMNPVEIVHIKT